MPGRRQDNIWIYYERIQKGAGWKAKCKKCGLLMQGIVERLKAHFTRCSAQVDDDITVIESSPAEPHQTPNAHSVCEPSTSTLKPPSPKKARAKTKLNSFVVTTTKSEKEELDKLWATMIYATNCPFHIVEHPAFAAAIEQMRPGYKLPSRLEISENLLNTVHAELQEKCKERLTDKTVCMSLDGWSNVHNEPVICAAVTDLEGNTFVTDTIDTSGSPHMADYLETVATKAMDNAEERYNCKVRSFVTDNAANMAAMRRSSANNEIIDVIAYGCGAHQLNLLAKDLQIPDVQKHVVKVVKYFRNTHLPASW